MADNTKKLESLSPIERRKKETQEALNAIEDQRKGPKAKMESESEYARRMRSKKDED